MSVQVFFDGGVRPHPNGGFACCYGWIAKRDGKIMFEGSSIERLTRNIGSCAVEQVALIKAMKSLLRRGLGDQPVVIVGDSQAVISLSAGQANASDERVKSFCNEVSTLCRKFKAVHFQWVPRELNREADRLGRTAFRTSPEMRKRHKLIVLANEELSHAVDSGVLGVSVARWCELIVGKARFGQMSEKELHVIRKSVALLTLCSTVPQAVH